MYGLNFLLIFWLNCNILTCCPTLFFFSVLYSCPQCWISSLSILQHPLLQTFTPPTSSPQARKISLQSSTSHMAIPSGFPYNLSSSSFLLSAVSLAVSHSLYLCFLACQLGLFKAMSVLTCWPAAPSCLPGMANNSLFCCWASKGQWEGGTPRGSGRNAQCPCRAKLRYFCVIPDGGTSDLPLKKDAARYKRSVPRGCKILTPYSTPVLKH